MSMGALCQQFHHSQTPNWQNSTGATTRIGQIRGRLPQISDIVRQQGALIALIIVVTFSFIRYNNFDAITIN